MNFFAPLKTKLVSVRPAAPWMNIAIKAQKKIRRKAERLNKKTLLTIHRDIFRYQKNKTTQLINHEKAKYINEKISSSSNSKVLYSVFNNLTGKRNAHVLPSDTPIENLPDKFNTFFIDKISNIRSTLDSVSITQINSSQQYKGPIFNCFFAQISNCGFA